MTQEKEAPQLNRSFARRIGKTLSGVRKNLLETRLPNHLYSLEKLSTISYKKTFLEIGFGMGEHFVNQIKLNPDSLYIGAEVYINGVAKVLKDVEKASNFLIWPDDLDLMLSDLPDDSLDGIYILFPDPWHKRRHLKKRLFNSQRHKIFKKKLKNNGFISFASDISSYFKDVSEMLILDSEMKVENKNFSLPHDGYIETKYHQKAIKEGRGVEFITSYNQEK